MPKFNNILIVGLGMMGGSLCKSIKKNKLSKKINLNKLNTNQKIYITIDQSENKIKNFIFQISNKEKIQLSKNKDDYFNQKVILTKLEKRVL